MELPLGFTNLAPGQYERIVDIGASEGYYAVGLAVRTKTPVDAYETEARSQKFCRQMALISGVSDLVQIHKWCDQRSVRELAGHRCFILSDCEGYEVPLITTDVIQALSASDIIVELHEGANKSWWFATEATRAILEPRFAATHDLTFVTFRQRDPSQFPEASFLGADALKAVSEDGRGAGQQWLIAESRIAAAG